MRFLSTAYQFVVDKKKVQSYASEAVLVCIQERFLTSKLRISVGMLCCRKEAHLIVNSSFE